MTADAVVVAAAADGCVDLEFAPRAECGACAGTCLWKRLSAARLERIAATAALRPGVAVTVSLSERQLLHASLLVHGMPLVAILIGAAAGAGFTGTDAGTLAGAAIAFLGVAALFGRWRKRIERATLDSLVIAEKR